MTIHTKDRFDAMFDALNKFYANEELSLDVYDTLFTLLLDVERPVRDGAPYDEWDNDSQGE